MPNSPDNQPPPQKAGHFVVPGGSAFAGELMLAERLLTVAPPPDRYAPNSLWWHQVRRDVAATRAVTGCDIKDTLQAPLLAHPCEAGDVDSFMFTVIRAPNPKNLFDRKGHLFVGISHPWNGYTITTPFEGLEAMAIERARAVYRNDADYQSDFIPSDLPQNGTQDGLPIFKGSRFAEAGLLVHAPTGTAHVLKKFTNIRGLISRKKSNVLGMHSFGCPYPNHG